MPLKKEAIGAETDEFTFTVEADRIIAYAKATNEVNPIFLDESREGGIIAPPIFNVVPAWQASGAAMSQVVPPTDFPRLVHGEQDMRFFEPVRPGDVLTSKAKVISVEEKATGETATAEITTKNQDDKITTVSRMTIFIRGTGSGARPPKAPEPERGKPDAEVTQQIDNDQTFRYAEASGDRNPIHLDENFAKSVGLPGIINHGLCTMAFVSRAAIEALADNDPLRLKRLKVRFSKPVLPGQKITTRFWKSGSSEDGNEVYEFETVNEEGVAVIKDGIAEIAPA
jgi:acyl dehydratase